MHVYCLDEQPPWHKLLAVLCHEYLCIICVCVQGKGVLHIAAVYSNKAMARTLLDHGANVNADSNSVSCLASPWLPLASVQPSILQSTFCMIMAMLLTGYHTDGTGCTCHDVVTEYHTGCTVK